MTPDEPCKIGLGIVRKAPRMQLRTVPTDEKKVWGGDISGSLHYRKRDDGGSNEKS